MEEDKEVVKEKTLSKASSKIKRIMIQIEAHVEEEIFKEVGAKEDAKIIKGMMQMIVVVGIVADQTTLKGIAHNKVKAIDDNKKTMHLAIIRMIYRDL